MSTTTNPNTCPLCLSPLQGTYHHAPPGREWWTWRCLVCDPMETPAYESVETRESLLARLAALTAERDALAALLKDVVAASEALLDSASSLASTATSEGVPDADVVGGHDLHFVRSATLGEVDCDIKELRAALARIDAASGRRG